MAVMVDLNVEHSGLGASSVVQVWRHQAGFKAVKMFEF
jgi:hypothetical protein